jgi:hypothetical protein
MTIPVERTNAVIWTESFLKDLLDPKKTPRVPKSVRQQAARCLRHYPSQWEMDTIAAREDGEAQTVQMKIFGRGFV